MLNTIILNEMLKRILIIDDDEEHREILLETLTYYNFEVNVLADGKRLFEVIESFNPDLVLLDYILPGENGIVLCEKIRNNPGTSLLPVILMSAYLGALDDISCCNSILYKPFDLEVLLKRINEICYDEHIVHH